MSALSFIVYLSYSTTTTQQLQVGIYQPTTPSHVLYIATMLPSSLTKFTFIPLLLLLYVFVPAFSIPVHPRPSLARSLDTTTNLQSDSTAPKLPHITWADTSLSKGLSQPRPDAVDHRPYPSSRLFARTYLDPHDRSRSLPLPQVETLADHRVAASLHRRWGLFDKIKQGFQVRVLPCFFFP